MRSTVAGSLACALAVLCGCGGGREAAELTFPGVTATEAGARVVVRRSPQVMGATATYVVLFDGRPVANLGSGESTSFPAPAGVHVIGLECGGRGVFGQSNQISADLAPGRTYTITAFASLTRGCEMRYEVS